MVVERAQRRPLILVLAGVNGAGKSSVGGALLREQSLIWFNPDTFSRELMARRDISKAVADGDAWAYGKRRLEAAIANKTDFAFETTLGGRTITRLIGKAVVTHDVTMIFWGLDSVERHISRVKSRARHGGHDIPEEKIKERWTSARQNLIALLPRLAHLQVFDNSTDARPSGEIPEPILVLEMKRGRVLYPEFDDVSALRATPNWAKPIVAAAIRDKDD